MIREDMYVYACPANGDGRRKVVAEVLAQGEFSDLINTDSSTARKRFIKGVVERFGDIDSSWLDDYILRAAKEVDAKDPGDNHKPKKKAREPIALTTIPLTDYGNAERFVAQHGDNVRYSYVWAKYLVWNGKQWEIDNGDLAERLAKQTVRSIYQEAINEADPDKRGRIAKWAIQSEKTDRLRGLLWMARSEKPITIGIESLDADPWLFNVQNGTINLKTGELQEHRREDYITKISPVEYPTEPGIDPDLWLTFLHRIFEGNGDLISFVQRLLGMAIVGEVFDHALPILYGTGCNGKTVFIETPLGLLGEDYSLKCTQDLLMVSRGDRHPTEKADLFGKRLVAAVESDDGRRLAESTVKELTGGDTIAARHMRCDFFRFRPSHSQFLITNHKPIIRGTDYAIWRRIHLVPFNVRIPDQEQDTQLVHKLRAEWPAILRWIVEGCLQWQRQGLDPPQAVRAATEEYRQDEDILGEFIADRCLVGPRYQAKASQLYAAYRAWSEDNGVKPANQTRFGISMAERGFGKSKSGTKGYLGVCINEN